MRTDISDQRTVKSRVSLRGYLRNGLKDQAASALVAWSRRRFLKTGSRFLGSGLGGMAAWISLSGSRRARMLREWVQDIPREPIVPAAVPTPLDWPANRVTISWLGHSTMLIDFYGLRILTDPVFSSRVGLGAGVGTLGPKRRVVPALHFAQLPPVDLVLLSHAHMDHFDLPSLRQFSCSTPVITAEATGELLKSTPFQRVTELRWGEATAHRSRGGDLRVEAFEVRHWGGRWPGDKQRGYNGYLLQREGRTLLFGGDTALATGFRELRPRGPYAVAMMPIGSYNPSIRNHCTPEEALSMANASGAHYFVPMHYGTFKLSDEPPEEPIERLEYALMSEPERLGLRSVGETFSIT